MDLRAGDLPPGPAAVVGHEQRGLKRVALRCRDEGDVAHARRLLPEAVVAGLREFRGHARNAGPAAASVRCANEVRARRAAARGPSECPSIIDADEAQREGLESRWEA